MGNVPQEGEVVEGRYRLESLLGEGGFGAVWKAMQLNVDRHVAIKFLKALVADVNALRRFEREAKALGRLQHPNCVMLLDFGHGESGSFLVTEFVDGERLDHWAEGDHEINEILAVARQVLEALQHAHGQRIVHRDLKPANIVVGTGPDGAIVAKVLDFGIASVVGAKRGDITKTGEVFGTPGYMSPEQLLGESNVGPPADLYAFGTVLYQMIEQRKLFTANSGIEVAMKHLTQAPPKLERPSPAGLQQVLDRLLTKKAEDRFQSAEEVLRALSRLGAVVDPSAELPQPQVPRSMQQNRAMNTPPPAMGRPPMATPTPQPPGGASPSREFAHTPAPWTPPTATPTPQTGQRMYDDRVSPGWTPRSTERSVPVDADDGLNLKMVAIFLVVLVAGLAAIAWQLLDEEGAGEVAKGEATRAVSSTLLRNSSSPPSLSVESLPSRNAQNEAAATTGGGAPPSLDLPTRSEGCDTPVAAPGFQRISARLSAIDQASTYVYVPKGYQPSRPHRTLLAMHDTGQSPRELITELGLQQAADDDNVVIVLPHVDTLFNPWKSGEHILIAQDALSVAQKKLCLRPSNVLLFGFGSGGHAAQKLACRLPSVASIVISTYRKIEGDKVCQHGDIPHLFLAPTNDGRDPVVGGHGCLQGDDVVKLDHHEELYRQMYGCDGGERVWYRRKGSVCKTWDCRTKFVSCRVDGGRALPRQETVPRIAMTPLNCVAPAADFPYGEKIWSFLMESSAQAEADEPASDDEAK